MERKENVIFLGPPGVGKTHLAISLAIAAAQSGRRVYYGALADLITSLEEAKTTGQLGRRLKILTYPSLLVIDEIGYLPVSQTGAMLFFQLINRRYERASTVLTSNKGFEEWGQILGDEVMAAALIDRLLHHCHIVNIRGSSYRMRKHTDLSKILHSPPAESSPSPPKRRESKSKGENDELQARHLRQVCNFRWPDLCSFRWPVTIIGAQGRRILLGEERHGRHIASHVQPRGLVARLAILLQDAQNVGIEGGGFVHCRWRPIGGGYRQGVGLLGSAPPATGPRTATPVTTSEP